eukprot:Skav206758  [mRNA]  locus=scaffold167:241723:246797:- [translate_table: standard]
MGLRGRAEGERWRRTDTPHRMLTTVPPSCAAPHLGSTLQCKLPCNGWAASSLAMRLVRVARIIRMLRFFSELRVMVNGSIMGSAKPLLWAFVFLLILMFIVGVTFMQLAANYISQDWGSVMTLYMAISGGIDWQDCVLPLQVVSPVMEYMFATYVFFTLFCCLNIVSADEDAMYLEAEEFAKGLKYFQGPAQSIHVYRLMKESARLHDKACAKRRLPFLSWKEHNMNILIKYYIMYYNVFLNFHMFFSSTAVLCCGVFSPD